MSSAIFSAKFISSPSDYGTVCPVFRKDFSLLKPICRATLTISALGMYETKINGTEITHSRFNPGWTEYTKRLQYREFDITKFLTKENEILIYAGNGWCVGNLVKPGLNRIWSDRIAVIAVIELEYSDGEHQTLCSGPDWECAKSEILFSEIYHGEEINAGIVANSWEKAAIYQWDTAILVPFEHVECQEFERLKPQQVIYTPKQETVLDFGQEITGYVEVTFRGNPGDIIEFDHAEVLDKDGNFYIGNLRSAKQNVRYICSGKIDIFRPHFSFQGFRYIRIKQFPGKICPEQFTAVVVHSSMERTGQFECSDTKLNRLYQNVIWGQKSNFLDIPTDCPQRDERLGWTGDAQVFCKTAAYNFNVSDFFRKWLRDLRACQAENGGVPSVIPDALRSLEKPKSSSAWGDAAVIVPWQMYLAYGDKSILEEQFNSMKAWIDYIRCQGNQEALWDTGSHFGDWLALDVPSGTYVGATDPHLIATAFFAYSTSLFIKAGKVLQRDMSEYETLYPKILRAFREKFQKEDGTFYTDTQTACVLALYFDLIPDKAQCAKRLAEKIMQNGNKLNTGFVGTAYLLDALSENGYTELAYSLLLQQEFPSWLFSVNMGATTIWEHWDGMRPDGSMWSDKMNSFNHYAYGAVAGWMYGTMAGIRPTEEAPGYRHILLQPMADSRLQKVSASLKTAFGTICSSWQQEENGKIRYSFSVPEGTIATIILPEQPVRKVFSGTYQY